MTFLISLFETQIAQKYFHAWIRFNRSKENWMRVETDQAEKGSNGRCIYEDR